jgi:hypothetical protein
MVVPLRNFPLIGRRSGPSEVVTFLDAEKPDTAVCGWLKTLSGNSYTQLIVGERNDGILHLVRVDGSIDSVRIDEDAVALCYGGSTELPAPCSLFRPSRDIISRLRKTDALEIPRGKIEWVRSENIPTRSGRRIADSYFELSPAMRSAMRAVDCRKRSGAVPDAASAGLVSVGADDTGRTFFEGAARCLTERLLDKDARLLQQWSALQCDGGAVWPKAPGVARAFERRPEPLHAMGFVCERGMRSARDDIAVTVSMILAEPNLVQKAILTSDRVKVKVSWLYAQGYITRRQFETVLQAPLRMRMEHWLASVRGRARRSESFAHSKINSLVSDVQHTMTRSVSQLSVRALSLAEKKLLRDR